MTTAGATSTVTLALPRGISTITSKISHLASTPYTDSEFAEGLQLLDGRDTQSTADARRQLRLNVQKEVIDTNGDVLDSFSKVAQVSKNTPKVGTEADGAVAIAPRRAHHRALGCVSQTLESQARCGSQVHVDHVGRCVDTHAPADKHRVQEAAIKRL